MHLNLINETQVILQLSTRCISLNQHYSIEYFLANN